MKKNMKILWTIILFFGLLLLSSSTYAIAPNNDVPINPETVEITEYSITLKKIEGYEYSIDEGRNWQNSNIFSFLAPDTTYSFVQRIKETTNYEYSSNSQIVKVTTNSVVSKPINKVPDGYTSIYNIEDLKSVKNDLSGKYILMNDIRCDSDMNAFEPIGDINSPFTGIFNGNNYSIVGIKQNNNTDLGLFGYNSGIVMNLSVINSNFQISENGEIVKTIGNIAGENSGEIINCYCKNQIIVDKGTVLGGKKSLKQNRSWYGDEIHIGGIIGINYGKIYYCNFDGLIDITTQEQYSNIGGIAGYNRDTISYCYNLADIVSNNGFCSSTGGICGNNTSYIRYTYNLGSISNINSYIDSHNPCFGSVGQIVGSNESYGNLSYSYTIGKNIGERSYTGILCGFNNGTIYSCYSMYGDKEFINGSGEENNCYYMNNFVETSISQGINASRIDYGIHFDWNPNLIDEIIISNNLNYPFPYSKKLGMINVKSNFIDYDGGNGLLNNPFRISNKEQLKNISKNPYSYYVLVNDIVFDSNELFEPIDSFYGVLDGNGYKIYNLNINDNSEYTGLFRINNGKILNLDIINPNIINTEDGYAGVYAGKSTGLIYNCKTEGGTLKVNSSIVGGIIGENNNKIQFCCNKNRIEVNTLDTSYATYVGGLSGFSGGCENSSNFGDIIIHSKSTTINGIGGITGDSGGATNCFNAGNIYFDSNIETAYDCFSGISCGSSYLSMKNCYNVGKIDYTSKSKKIMSAGIATFCDNQNGIQNCYYLDGSVIVTDNVLIKGTKLGNLQMQSKNNYNNFDFVNVWQMENNQDYPYPTLLQPEISKYEIQFTIYGNIKGSNINSKRVKIKLINQTNNTIIIDNGYVNDDGYYEINNLEPGNYLLTVLRDNQNIKTQSIILNDSDIKKDLNIYDKGDINGDGKINGKDWNRLYEHINETNLLTEEEFERADVNNDGKVNGKDWNRLYEHINETNPLF